MNVYRVGVFTVRESLESNGYDLSLSGLRCRDWLKDPDCRRQRTLAQINIVGVV